MTPVPRRPRRAATAIVACASLTLGLGALAPSAQAAPNEAPTIIPALQTWTGGEGRFTLTPSLRIVVDGALRGVGEQFATDLADATGLSLPVVTGTAGVGDVYLDLDEALTSPEGGDRFAEEGYEVETTATAMTLTAPSEQGAFYATRTVLQGLVQSPGRTSFPVGSTLDWPDYETRGFSLDVGRRFLTPESVRDYITMMSWYKLNEFQIHLNDNEIFKPATGWKDAYAGFRLKSDNPYYAGLASEDGAYDRADWQSFEDVAASHGVQIVPEMDVPAHSLPFILWKPELGLNGGESDHLDLTKPATTVEIKKLFDEFVPWFEGPEVHYGADEYPRQYADQYRTFFNEMAAHVRSPGKHPRAWGSMSVMHGSAEGYDRDVTISAWNDGWYGMASAETDGYDYINMNDSTLYVVPFADYYHGSGLNNQGLYDNWYPNRLWDTDTVPAGAPRGAMFAVWNDLVNADYTELGVHGLVRDSFAVIAQKSWKAQRPALSYARFAEVRTAIGSGPGIGLIDEGTTTGGQLPVTGIESSGASAAHPATNLTDGLTYTRWQAEGDASFTLDLGTSRTVGSVRVEWAQPAPASFDILVSNDGSFWRTVADDEPGSTDAVAFTPTSARYVRVLADAAGATVGAWSASVSAPQALSLGAAVTASGQEAASMGPALAVDGNLTTRWSANYVDQPWIQLDLGTAREFAHVDLAWEAASATGYRIEVSTDGVTWTEVATRSGLATGARTGQWTDATGRLWRTECDTALTGRNGCRTWALADVIVRDTSQGPTTYRWKKIMLLNNMVRFR